MLVGWDWEHRPRLPRLCGEAVASAGPMRRAAIVDVETTGRGSGTTKLSSLRSLPFAFGPEGEVREIGDLYVRLREPSVPMHPDAALITGLDKARLVGLLIDADETLRVVDDATLLIGHNGAFDRQMLERLIPEFRHFPWACSLTEVPWRKTGQLSAPTRISP